LPAASPPSLMPPPHREGAATVTSWNTKVFRGEPLVTRQRSSGSLRRGAAAAKTLADLSLDLIANH